MANIPDVNFNKIPNKGVKFNQTEYYEDNFEKINQQIVPKVNELDAQLAEKANKAQEDWITPTLLNGWVEVSGFPFRYRKDNFNNLQLKGRVTGGSLGTPIFTLPTGYRPVQTKIVMSGASTVTPITIVGATGNVQANTGSNTNVHIDLIIPLD